MIEPGFYRGRLWHRRHEPRHGFDREILLALACVDEIDRAPRGVLPLAGRWPLSLRRQDHLSAAEGAETTLREAVAEHVAASLGRTPSGPMLLLSQPRSFGLTFDPVSFVYCFGADGVEAVVAEVTNTPWGERHVYVLTEAADGDAGDLVFRTPKRLHVSPFFEMDHEYTFALTAPGDRMRLSITNRRAGQRVFEAGFVVERVAPFGRAWAAPVLRHALMPWETVLGIYGQAARLAWKRVPFHAHPSRRPALEGAGPAPLDSGGRR